MTAWLVETLLASTGLMLLVLLMRAPVRRLFGAQAAYALWLLPALRMVLPPLGALFPASVPVNAVTQASGAIGAMVQAQIADQMIGLPGATADIVPVALDASPSLWIGLFALLWLAGLVIFLIRQVQGYRRFCSFILCEATLRDEVAPGIMLVSSPRARGPMAFGLRRRFVVLPADADQRFDDEEQAMALAHELAHHARGDLVANVFALVMLALHWCNPLAWFAYRAFRNDQELACDADVIAQVRGSRLGHAYGRALVKSATDREFAAACNLITVDRLKRRLAMLSSKSPSSRRRKTGLLLTGTVVMSGLILTASGESMAAQVGARVSEAMPFPQAQALLPSLPTAPAPAARMASIAPNALADAGDRLDRLADATDAVAPPPAPPVPPLPPVPPVPLAPNAAPPAPPAPSAPPAPPAKKANGRTVAAADSRSKGVITHNVQVDLAGRAHLVNVNIVVPDVGVSSAEDCDGGAPVRTTEQFVEKGGKSIHKIKVVIRQDEIDRQVRAARAQALAGVEQAHAEIARTAALRSEIAQAQAHRKSGLALHRAEVAAELARAMADMRARGMD